MKKYLVLLGLGSTIGLGAVLAYEWKKKAKVNRLEDAISSLAFTQESMTNYLENKNKELEERIESVVEEVGSVYEHLEYIHD